MGIGLVVSIFSMIIKACVGALVGLLHLVGLLGKGIWACITGFFRFSKWAIKKLAGA